jgi:hypothetical protein
MLPTKSNLAIRGIIPPEVQFCVVGCGAVDRQLIIYFSHAVFLALFGHQLGRGLTFSVDSQNMADHFI